MSIDKRLPKECASTAVDGNYVCPGMHLNPLRVISNDQCVAGDRWAGARDRAAQPIVIRNLMRPLKGSCGAIHRIEISGPVREVHYAFKYGRSSAYVSTSRKDPLADERVCVGHID